MTIPWKSYFGRLKQILQILQYICVIINNNFVLLKQTIFVSISKDDYPEVNLDRKQKLQLKMRSSKILKLSIT